MKFDVGRKRRPWTYRAKQSQSFDCGFPEPHRATGVRLRRSCRIADWGQPWGRRADRATTPRCPVPFRQQTQLAGANYAKRTQSADPGPGGHRPGDLTGGAFSRADCAKQTQFAFERNEGQVLWGKGVMVNCTYKGHWKNKANSRWMGRGLGDEGRGCRQTTNKANCPKRGTEAVSGRRAGESHERSCRSGELRQTNPISGGAGRGEATGAWDEGRIVRNEANLVESNMPNEPNPPIRTQVGAGREQAMAKMVASRPIRGTILNSKVHP